MPYPEFDKTTAALLEAWAWGPATGAAYREKLRTKFDAAPNKAQIDAALSLGIHMDHSVQNQQKRQALRAAMLAKFLMMNYTVAQRDQLKAELEHFDTPALKRVFSSSFPAIQDNGNRPAWTPSLLTHPNTLNALMAARTPAGPNPPVPDFRFIVHSINTNFEVFDNPNVLRTYEVLSMSLMSRSNPFAHDPQGLILSVPAFNILAASPTDVAVLNKAASFHGLTRAGEISISENLLDVAIRTDGLKSPDFLVQNRRAYPYYNEVVVCGRSDVPLPHGRTGVINVVGLFVLTDPAGVIRPALRPGAERLQILQTAARTLGIPLLYIPNNANGDAV